jgi:uncharacterized protein (TIRG00374 family)
MAVTIVLLFLVLREVGVDELTTAIQQANPAFLGLAFVIGTATVLTSASKDKVLLEARGYRVSYWYLLKLCLVGMFFNNFLPTNVGGDVVRSYEIGRRINDPASAVAVIFVERLTGFLVLVLVAAVSWLTHLSLLGDALLSVVMLAAIVGLLGMAWLAIDPRLLNWIEGWLPFPVLRKYLGKFRKFQNALHHYRHQRGALAQNIGWSLVFYVMVIVYIFAAVSAFYQPVDLFGLAFVVPITMVVAMMPVTFNGIGLQEWSYVLLFPLIGVPASAALLAILAVRAITLISAIAGGVLYLQMKSQRQEEGVSAGVQTGALNRVTTK